MTKFKQGLDLPYIFCQGGLRNSILFDDGLEGEVKHNLAQCAELFY